MNDQVCELCCGAGGMALGFSQYYDIVQAIDHSEPVVRTYGSNHPDTSTRKLDIRNITGCSKDFDGLTGVIGGPPCQGSSIMNTKRCADDPRNEIMGEFMRLVSEIKPNWFVMENVPGVPKEIKSKVMQSGIDSGYTLTSVYLNAADHGASQTRKRWIFVGSTSSKWTPPLPTGCTTVRDALSHITKNWGVMQSKYETLSRLQHATHEWTPITGKFKNMIKLSWDSPSPAVVNLKKVYMVHPDECRNISLAEAAALQGFPNNYIWKGTDTEIAQMIANAMPAQLAESIARSLKEV